MPCEGRWKRRGAGKKGKIGAGKNVGAAKQGTVSAGKKNIKGQVLRSNGAPRKKRNRGFDVTIKKDENGVLSLEPAKSHTYKQFAHENQGKFPITVISDKQDLRQFQAGQKITVSAANGICLQRNHNSRSTARHSLR